MKSTNNMKKHIKIIKPKKTTETSRLAACAPLSGT